MSVHIEHETPDTLAAKIIADRALDQATASLRSARDVERVERDIAVAREFANTARLARALAQSN